MLSLTHIVTEEKVLCIMFACNLCSTVNSWKEDLICHFKSCHLPPSSICPLCWKTCNRKDALLTHQGRKHTSKLPHQELKIAPVRLGLHTVRQYESIYNLHNQSTSITFDLQNGHNCSIVCQSNLETAWEDILSIIDKDLNRASHNTHHNTERTFAMSTLAPFIRYQIPLHGWAPVHHPEIQRSLVNNLLHGSWWSTHMARNINNDVECTLAVLLSSRF